jgi:hypothetical protein
MRYIASDQEAAGAIALEAQESCLLIERRYVAAHLIEGANGNQNPIHQVCHLGAMSDRRQPMRNRYCGYLPLQVLEGFDDGSLSFCVQGARRFV